jgi:transporter family protein
MTWVAWSLLSAVFAAASAILAKLGVANINSNLATAIRTSVVFLLAHLLQLATQSRRNLLIPYKAMSSSAKS